MEVGMFYMASSAIKNQEKIEASAVSSCVDCAVGGRGLKVHSCSPTELIQPMIHKAGTDLRSPRCKQADSPC